MQATLADFALQLMNSVAVDLARPGGFVPAFRAIYRDQSPMITVGGVLPAKGALTAAEQIVDRENWPSKPVKPIIAPHLTMKEATILQAQLPCNEAITREKIQQLGFDLESQQIEAFQRYYRQYPAFAQIVS